MHDTLRNIAVPRQMETLEPRRLLSSITNIPGLLVRNVDMLPSNDRLVFNRITNRDPIRPNVFHDVGQIRLSNASDHTIVLKSLQIVNKTYFRTVSGAGFNISIPPGQSHYMKIRFAANITDGSMVKAIGSNVRIISGDKTDGVALAGLWQKYSEQTPTEPKVYDEPSLAQLVRTIFGYQVNIANENQAHTQGYKVSLGSHGERTAVGDEVLSGYWTAANTAAPVTVRMLAAWHRQNNFDPNTGAPTTAAATVRYFYNGSAGSAFKLFQHNINEGQSVIPHNSGTSSGFAQASFTPTGGKTFGFKVDSRYTDDKLNPLDFNLSNPSQRYANTGHAVRFFPLKNVHGTPVANTYIMAMDYTALSYSNYDYQDNIYIVSNINPAQTAQPMALARPASNAALFSATSVNKDAADDGLI